MARVVTIISLAIGLSALFLLMFFGLAIWVFLPLLPAGIVFAISVIYGRKRATKPAQVNENETDTRKAA